MEALSEVLLLHDGELSDVAELLDTLEVDWLEGRSARSLSGTPGLVIGTPPQLLRWRVPGDPRAVARIALCDGGSRTLDSRLQKAGVDFVLRRPVHPEAVRLLVLHMIYRGPERRRLRRVNAGLPIRFRAGLWPRRGLLLEFSVAGCRLLTASPLAAGRRLRVRLPAEVGLGRNLSLRGCVARCEPAPAGSQREHVVAVEFGDLPADAHQRLAAAVVARARRTAPTESAPGTRRPADRLETAPSERRQLPRGEYTKAVHGRLGEAQVVLMGSNLSPKGMQVDPDARLRPGARVKLDLYGHGDIPPLRLEARVTRDDGERGLFLQFENLWPGAPALLERLIKTLPLVTPGSDGRGMVISEVVESD